jgi:nucleotide-binding universal stress UspA family protein
MIRKLLVAYDGSEQAEKAFDTALEIAVKFDATIFVLSVATLPEPPEAVELQAVLENATEFYEKHFDVLRKKAAGTGLKLQYDVSVGHPAEQIIARAKVEAVDMIIMGHRGKTFVQRWLLGSVSKRVLSYAQCTVVIVR